jgi:hypothetical protein
MSRLLMALSRLHYGFTMGLGWGGFLVKKIYIFDYNKKYESICNKKERLFNHSRKTAKAL